MKDIGSEVQVHHRVESTEMLVGDVDIGKGRSTIAAGNASSDLRETGHEGRSVYFFVVLVVGLLVSVTSPSSAELLQLPGGPLGVWNGFSGSMQGVTMEADLPKSDYLVGESIPLTCTIENTSSVDVLIEEPSLGPSMSRHVHVYNSTGERSMANVGTRHRGLRGWEPGMDVDTYVMTLAAGEELSFTLDLADTYTSITQSPDPLPDELQLEYPDDYFAQCYWWITEDYSVGALTGRIASAPVAFTISPDPSKGSGSSLSSSSEDQEETDQSVDQ